MSFFKKWLKKRYNNKQLKRGVKSLKNEIDYYDYILKTYLDFFLYLDEFFTHRASHFEKEEIMQIVLNKLFDTNVLLHSYGIEPEGQSPEEQNPEEERNI